ncbi:uncharacterized protein LOC143567213 [Bidens hawaiensis]|uniref:uncharacterized protein LOC143567213 n=1 Tax=Bidens hawaiensis TaxID=980011 RepID=UPI004049B636
MVRVQGLRRDFETIQMKDGEVVSDFLSKVMKLVNKQRAYGEDVADQKVVEKVLRSLPDRWNHVVAAIEESKDLSTLSFDQLMGSLQVHEVRLNRNVQPVEEEHAFQAKEDESGYSFRGRGRGSARSRGRGRGRGFGRGREREDEDEEGRLFMVVSCDSNQEEALMANNKEEPLASNVWFLDSGCSNHMTRQKGLFKSLDDMKKLKVRMGNGNGIQVEGKGVVKIQTNTGKHRTIEEVQFAPDLSYNLLSVGQLMRAGHSILFDEGECTITNKRSGQVTYKIPMANNNTFHFDITQTSTVLSTMRDESWLWHLRYGHLNEVGIPHVKDVFLGSKPGIRFLMKHQEHPTNYS